MNTTTTGPLIKNALRVRQRSLACVVRELHTSRRSLHGTTATRFMASAAMASASAAPSKYSALEQQVKKIYLDRFPCTLHYYSSRGPKLHLFDRRKLLERERAHGEAEGEEDEDPHRLGQDAVPVDDQGQIDLRGGQALPPWPGAALHPNTNVRLEITRSWIEWAEECRTARGQDVATPWFFTIPKGERAAQHTSDPRRRRNVSNMYRQMSYGFFSSSSSSSLQARYERRCNS